VESIATFLAELYEGSGLSTTAAIVLGTAVVLALIIVSVIVALGRRIDRLEESLMDLRQLHIAMQETHTDQARAATALASIASALPELAEIKQQWRGATSQQTELISAVAKLSIDLESVRESVATSVLSAKADLMTLQKSMEEHHHRMEMLQTAIASLPTIENEQRKVYKLLKAWNSRVGEIEQKVAAVPDIQAGQAQLANELADWDSRRTAACEVLAEFLESQDVANERLPMSDPSAALKNHDST
jgi:chromosome segregation ATPase